MKNPNKLHKKHFVELAHHSRCPAHFRLDFFSLEESGTGREFYPDLSSERMHPECKFQNDPRYIQGTFMFLSESASDLYLMCSYYAEIGEPYYVFFDAHNEEDGAFDFLRGWVIWLPERKYG
tara:strand:+ start:527 stop:892 length:366 start_codon:yes stop_codon:yes gene_type:complete